jgi:hypothetical protein
MTTLCATFLPRHITAAMVGSRRRGKRICPRAAVTGRNALSYRAACTARTPLDADRKAAGRCEHEQLQHDERRERNEECVRRRGGHIGGQGDGDRNNGRDGGAAEPLDNVHSHRGEAQFFPRDGGIGCRY